MEDLLLTDVLTCKFGQALKAAFPSLEASELSIELTPATAEKFGHYQVNSAMRLSRSLKQPPRKIAEAIVQHLDKEHLLQVEIAGPGFINITFESEFLASLLQKVLLDPFLGVSRPKKIERIVVEFSAPNIAKEMHVGHLRSTIIGESIARLFEFLGYDVLRLNHIGDWGTAFGMLIAYMEEETPEVLLGNLKTDLSHLMHWYRESKKRFDASEEFKTRARLKVVALQGGDAQAKKAWEIICDISRKAFQEIYDLLEVTLIERGESFYNPELPKIVNDLEKRGIAQISQGATCIFIEGFDLPLMIQKTDGGYTYDTTDLAAMKQRVEVEKADRIIVVTDSGQSLHFKLIYEASIKAGYLDPKKVRFDHVPFGVVLGLDGKKFRTRSGETEKLIDLLQAAIVKAKEILKQREHDLTDEEVEALSPILGIDAVKYADLASNRISDYVFSYDRMLRFEGNTAAFILYSFVRVNGIKRKAKDNNIEKLKKEAKITLKHSSEITLALHLLRFGETLQTFSEELTPHTLTEYLYLLAQKFNAFFRDCQVVGSEDEASRLLICEIVSKTLEKGLHILGLRTVDKM